MNTPTTTELGEAAERLERVNCGEAIADVYPDSEGGECSTTLSDTELLCDAWIDEYLADDVQITDEWILTFCDKNTHCYRVRGTHYYVARPCSRLPHGWLLFRHEEDGEETNILTVQFRGELVRLLSALKVESEVAV